MQHGTYWERFQTESFSFIELNYALVQAYDFLHLYREYGCIVQIGGNDQWFNILAGRDLIRRADGGEAFALTTPLITTSSGQKMSKSAGNAPWLDPRQTSPYEYYQYWRNTEDADVGRFLRLFTFLPLEEIAELERLSGAELNRAKEVLAFEATRITHGEEEARRAQADGARSVRRRRAHRRGAERGGRASRRGWSTWPSRRAWSTPGTPPSGSIQSGGLRLNGQTQSTDRVVDPSELPAAAEPGQTQSPPGGAGRNPSAVDGAAAVGPRVQADGANQVVQIERLGDAGVDGHVARHARSASWTAEMTTIGTSSHSCSRWQASRKAKPSMIGHHQVQHDRRRAPCAHGVERLATMRRQVDGVALAAQRVGNKPANGRVVVDNQHVRIRHARDARGVCHMTGTIMGSLVVEQASGLASLAALAVHVRSSCRGRPRRGRRPAWRRWRRRSCRSARTRGLRWRSSSSRD